MAGVVVTGEAAAPVAPAAGGVADKGLRRGAIGFACAPYHRREARRSAAGLPFAVVAPAVGGVILTWVLVRSVIDLSDPANSESGNSWLGLGPPLVIGIGFMALGALLMAAWSHRERTLFERRAEVFDGGE